MRPTVKYTYLAITSLALAMSTLAMTASSASASPVARDAAHAPLRAPSYTGLDTKVPASYPAPKSCGLVGYQAPTESPQVTHIEIAAFQKQVAALGGKAIVLNDNLSETQQVSDFEELLADHVKAIEIAPLDPGPLTSLYNKAKAQHVGVISQQYTFGSPPTASDPFDTEYGNAVDYSSYLEAKWLWQQNAHANVVVIGYSEPVPSLVYESQREVYWAKKFGLNYLGEVTQSTDDAPGGQTAMTAALARWPQVNAVMSYSDRPAEGAAIAAKRAGKHVLTIGANGDSDAFASIKNRLLSALIEVNFVQSGIAQANAACTYSRDESAVLPRETEDAVRVVDKSSIHSARTLQGLLATTKFGRSAGRDSW